MLSIEYIHKRTRLFRIERILIGVASIAVLFLLWRLAVLVRIL
jgi:hypothetical protein